MTEQSLPHQQQATQILTFFTILIYNNSFLIYQELQDNKEQYTFEVIIFYKIWHLFFSLTEGSSKFIAKSPFMDKRWAVCLKEKEIATMWEVYNMNKQIFQSLYKNIHIKRTNDATLPILLFGATEI